MMRLVLIALASALTLTGAEAAEIKALVSTAMKASFEEIAAQFEKATGHKVVASFGPTGGLTKRVLDGEAADLVIVGVPPVMPPDTGLGLLVKQQKIVPFSSAPLARSLIGAGVKPGAPKPDISSEAAFRAALLAANAIAVSDPAAGGGSGVFFGKLFAKMELADSLKPKLRYAAGGPGGYAGTIVMKGEAEFALQPIPELLAVPGLEVVGPLPGTFQNPTTYLVSIVAIAHEREAAKALIAALTAPTAAAIYQAKGLEP